MFPSLAWLLVALTLGGLAPSSAPVNDGGGAQLFEAAPPPGDTDTITPPTPPGGN